MHTRLTNTAVYFNGHFVRYRNIIVLTETKKEHDTIMAKRNDDNNTSDLIDNSTSSTIDFATVSSGFVIDFAKVPTMEPVPGGMYNAVIVSAKPGVSNAGNAKLDLSWQIEGGAHDKKRIFDTLTFVESALFRVRACLLAIGFPADFSGGIDPETLIGKRATLEVTIVLSDKINPATSEVYAPKNGIKKYSPAGEARTLDTLLVG